VLHDKLRSEVINDLEEFPFEMVSGSAESINKLNLSIENDLKNKKLIALGSFLFSSLLFFYNSANPSVSNIAILHAMEKDSKSFEASMCNNKPTLIDFYADWCGSCKAMVPVMRSLEMQYGDKINFITLDGTKKTNIDLVGRFKVDGIPHMAFMSKNNEVETALIGAVPKKIMKENLDALLKVFHIYLPFSD
jgi:thiol-disulfide isomerase/thioredoxin